MADSRPFDSFRLTLMQEVLPVGLAMVERIRQGGPASVVEPFTGSADPLGDLRAEGASSAEAVRERLDQVSPGLGNPVIQVAVDVDPTPGPMGSQHSESASAPTPWTDEQESLPRVLARIERRLDQLQQHLTP